MPSESNEETLDLPPFPPLAWDGGGGWEGDLVLPSWTDSGSDDPAYLNIQSIDEETRAAPTLEQTAAFRWLMENDAAARETVLHAVFREYPRLRKAYDYVDDDVMPPIDRPEELWDLIGLSTVHLITTSRDGMSYIGFGLGCAWDEEHGVGVMTHRGRVIEVGLAYISFDHEAAEKDGGAG